MDGRPSCAPFYADQGALRTNLPKEQTALRPERTSECEVGGDLTMFRDRAGISVTYYDARTCDAILKNPLASFSGYFDQIANAASLPEPRHRARAGRGAPLRAAASHGRSAATSRRTKRRWWDSATPTLNSSNSRASPRPPAFAVRGASIGVFRGLDFMRRGRDLTHLSVAIQ